MTQPHTLHIAIIGAGPAACYLAQALTRSLPDCSLTLFDQHVAPFGLIRSGVAADHQHTKAITRQFERLFAAPNVRFAGNIRVTFSPPKTSTPEASAPATTGAPATVPLAELRRHFDAVVIATGLFADTPLSIPGSITNGQTTNGILGAGSIIKTLNAYPGAPTTLPPLGTDIVLVGSGNVALDVLRFLVKGPEDYAQSDIAEAALAQYLAAPAERITVLSRSDASHAKGDGAMYAELAKLARGTYTARGFSPIEADPDAAPPTDRATAARLAAIRALTDPARPAYPGPHVTLAFGATPEAVLADQRVRALRISEAHGISEIPAHTVITAIGFHSDAEIDAQGHTSAATDSPADSAPSTAASEAPVFRTGWARRGPNGGIPENRTCAKRTADEIIAAVTAGSITTSPHTTGFVGLDHSVQEQAISFTQWQQLDAHECATALPGRVRRKVSEHHEMHRIATTPADA